MDFYILSVNKDIIWFKKKKVPEKGELRKDPQGVFLNNQQNTDQCMHVRQLPKDSDKRLSPTRKSQALSRVHRGVLSLLRGIISSRLSIVSAPNLTNLKSKDPKESNCF